MLENLKKLRAELKTSQAVLAEAIGVTQREFTAWLEAEKTMPDKGVKLHDSPPGIGKKAV